MSGVKAFLWLSLVVVITLCVLIFVSWVLNHGASFFVDNTP